MGWACKQGKWRLDAREAAITKTNNARLGAAGGVKSLLGEHLSLSFFYHLCNQALAIKSLSQGRLCGMNGSSISHTSRDVSAVHVWAATRVSMSVWSAVLYGWVYFKVAVARSAQSFFQICLCLYLNPSLSFLFPSVCNKSNYSRLKRPWQTCCMSSVLYSTKALKPIDIPMGLTERALTVHYNNFYSSRCDCFSSVLWCFVFPSHRNIVIIWQDTESSLEDQIWKFHKFKFRFKIIWLMFRFKLI